MDKNIVISISRKYGCGGRELAQILAEKLNIKLYDRKIVHIAAAKLETDDLNENDLLELENTVNPLTMAFFPFRSFGINLGEASRGIFLSEAKAIRRLVNSGSCVILGRCADFVLDDLPNHFSSSHPQGGHHQGRPGGCRGAVHGAGQGRLWVPVHHQFLVL